ncbi:MAG: hypothetical protein K2Y21_08640 [Phycisphaerales bacterium]|nr:hypothetical protein [Phycisphaerales bacterium]
MTFTVVVLWLSGMLLGGIGAFVLAWALFADRFRGEHGRRRCRRCWYEMTGVAGLQCPECGHVARDERHLHITRRYWRRAFTGSLVLLAGIGCGWYATGSVLGWRRVAPLGVLVRLAPIIGREAALRSVAEGFGPANRVAIPIESASEWLLSATEELAVSVVRDKRASIDEVIAARDVLQWMRTRVKDPFAVLAAFASVPMNHPAFRLIGAESQRQITYLTRIDENRLWLMIRSAALEPEHVGSQLIQDGLSAETASLAVDLVLSKSVPGTTWPELAQASPDAIAVFLRRCRERYFDGDDEIKHRVTRVVFPNWRAVPAGNADFEAMARHQSAETMRGETFEKWNGENLITWQLAGALSKMAPEVARLLDIEAARPRIEAIFRTNVAPKQMTPQVVSEALAEAICIGGDAARLAALRIADRRGDCDQAMLAEAAIAAVPLVRDSITLDALCRRVFDLTADGGALLGVEPRIDPDHAYELEAALVRNLAAPGQIGSVSARWLGMMPRPSDPAVKALRAAAQNAANSTPLRNAARDALLHIRDRANPGFDPLTPLELAAPR